MESIHVFTMLDLERTVMDWLERKMLDSSALSMGDVWHAVSQLLQNVAALQTICSAIRVTAERNSNVKVSRWTRDVSQVGGLGKPVSSRRSHAFRLSS